MSEEQINYLESGSGDPTERARLDSIRAVLAGPAVWADLPSRVDDSVPGEAARPQTPRRSTWVAVAVVSGALLIAVLAAAAGLFEQPAGSVVAMEGTEIQSSAHGEAEIRDTGSGWWISLEVDGLPPAPDGTYYEGWMWNDQGQGVSIGTFHLRSDEEPVILWSGVDPAGYPSVWVTLEDEDGDATASDRVVMMGRIGS